MTRSLAPYVEALLGIAAISWLTSAMLPVLGLASSALLFLLPVLLAATRGGLGPGLSAALGGAAAYNFFLLEPRYTFRVHQLDNLVSVIVLVAVAVVTSRLATRLMAREAEAVERATASEEAAALSAVLASGAPNAALTNGIAYLTEHFGELRLLDEERLTRAEEGLSSLDQSAAAWAVHNGDSTGHGTTIMAAADWTFLPLTPRNRAEGTVAALARPNDGRTRGAVELEHLAALCRLLGQSLDRIALDKERRERESLEQRDHLRRTLLASLGHDLRTPLTVITGQLKQLAPDHAAARDALIAAQRLDRMMADLIGAARIEAGLLTPAMESIDLVDAVSAACEGIVIPDGLSLDRHIPADLPFVSADPVLLHHILANLVHNALRHASARVTISAGVEVGGIVVRVEDDGPGVPECDRERVFSRFVRGEGSDRNEGSGLGLAIVKGFAEAMKMGISIGTSASGGASFALAMPVRESIHL